jgi:hypothetical protein
MKSNNQKAEIEEQIVSMLDKVMRDDIEESDNNTIDTSLDNNLTQGYLESRKNNRKSKTQNNYFTCNSNGPLGVIHDDGFLFREQGSRKSNTINLHHANPVGSYFDGVNSNNYFMMKNFPIQQTLFPSNLYGNKPNFYSNNIVPNVTEGYYGSNNNNNIINSPMNHQGMPLNCHPGINNFGTHINMVNSPMSKLMNSPMIHPMSSHLTSPKVNPMSSPLGSPTTNPMSSPMTNRMNNLMINPLSSLINHSNNSNINNSLNFKDDNNNNNNFLSCDDGNLKDVVFSELERLLSISDRIDEKLFARLKGNFINIIKTQNGSRVFQKYLKNTSSLILKSIFNELKYELNELMIDQYANYFCQKFFGFLDQDDRIYFLKEVKILII